MPLPPLTGTWALIYTVVSSSSLGIVARNRTVTTTWALVRTHAEGDTVSARHQVCDIEMDAGVVDIIVPEGWSAHALPKTWDARLSPGDEGTWRFEADMGATANGYDPRAGAFPHDASAPAIADTDRDGRPGATLWVHPPLLPEGWVAVASRTHPVLSGTTTGPDTIEGAVTLLDSEQTVLDASAPIYAHRPPIRQEPGLFRMVRLPEGAGCDAVLREAPEPKT